MNSKVRVIGGTPAQIPLLQDKDHLDNDHRCSIIQLVSLWKVIRQKRPNVMSLCMQVACFKHIVAANVVSP